MSAAKQRMMELRDQHAVATDLAVEAGVLRRCPYHDYVFDAFAGDNTPAYMLGNSRYSAGDFGALFHSRRELSDAIHFAVQDAAMECCGCCN